MYGYFKTITSRLLPPFLVYFIRLLLTREKFHLFRPTVIRKTLIFLRSQNGMIQANSGNTVLSSNKLRPGEPALAARPSVRCLRVTASGFHGHTPHLLLSPAAPLRPAIARHSRTHKLPSCGLRMNLGQCSHSLKLYHVFK